MEIPKELMDRWKTMRSPKDIAKMYEANKSANINKNTFYRAFTTGRCSPEVLEIMIKFFDQRALMLKKLFKKAEKTNTL